MSNPNDIMEKTGKNNKVILSSNSTFLNSDSIFIEYHDVIKSPYFSFLRLLLNNEIFGSLFDLSEIKGLDDEGLYEWYTNRKHQFVLDNFAHNEEMEIFKDINIHEWSIDFLYKEFDELPSIVYEDTALNFVPILVRLSKSNLVNKFYVYTEKYSEPIKKELLEAFPFINYVYGDMVEVIKENKIPYNSTFVLSDIRKIEKIKESGRLQQSSIVIADKYGYNYDGEKFVINLEEYFKDYIFKLDFFDNINFI